MKKLLINSDKRGMNTFSIPPSDSVAVALLDSAEKIITVPTGANFALFSSTDNFYVRVGAGATVAIPVGDQLVPGPYAEVNPAARSVDPGDEIHLIGPTGKVTVSFYA